MTRKRPPDVAAALARLADLPEQWTSDALRASVERRAVVQAAHRGLVQRGDDARARVQLALTLIEGGDLGAPMADLVDAEGELLAVERALTALPVPGLDATAVQESLARACAAVRASSRMLTVPTLALDEDFARWRTSCAVRASVYEPPVGTDSERALSLRRAELLVRIEAARSGLRSWEADAARDGGDPITLLAAAAGHIAAAEALTPEITSLAAEIEAANGDREARGDTWQHPLGEGVLV